MPRTRQWTLAMPGQWLCATVLALALLACGRQTASVPEVDHPAPPFTAQNLRGEAVSLGDWRGRPVLLDFWATWCKPCKEEFPAFQRLMEEIPELVVVAVAVGEGAQQVQPYMAQTGFPFVTLPDPRSQIARAYGVTALPSTCLIGPDGVLQRREVGQIDAAEWRVAILALLGSAAAATPTATGVPSKTHTALAVTTETTNTPLPAATSTLSPVADRTGTAKAVTTKTNTRTTQVVTTETNTGTSEVVTTKTSTATATLRPSPTPSPAPVATVTPPPTATPVPPTAPPPTAVPPTATPFRSRTPSPTRAPAGLRLDTCCTDKEVLPGQTVVFDATLTNTGGGRDRFDVWLNKALPGNWQGMFCIGTVCYLQGTVVVELDAGASQVIEVKVRAADNAVSGSQGHVTLGVASQSDASVRRSLSWSTTVVAPTPTTQPSPTASETAAPSPTATESPAPSATPTESWLPTATATQPPLPTATATEPETATPEPTMTEMPVPSATATETSVPTARPGDGGRAKE